MPFQKGNKYGGRRSNAGRKGKVFEVEQQKEKEIALAANELAKRYIQENIKPVLQTYKKLAEGWTETRYTLTGTPYEVWKYDSRTTCHWLDKIIPDIDAEAYQKPIAIAVNITTGLEPERTANSGSILTIGIDGDGHKNGGEET